MTRAEYLEASKQRALVYLERGQLADAVASMGSDLEQNAETKAAAGLVMVGVMMAANGDAVGVRRWIMGFR